MITKPRYAELKNVHDYLYDMARVVSNIGKPYTDNSFGRAAATVMRCYDAPGIDKILGGPPYVA